MQQLLFIIHALLCVFLILLVLLQHGKGADAGVALSSGASQTLFGAQTAMPFLNKLTVSMAVLFFLTSLALGCLNAHRVHHMKSIVQPTIPLSKTQ